MKTNEKRLSQMMLQLWRMVQEVEHHKEEIVRCQTIKMDTSKEWWLLLVFYFILFFLVL